MPCCECMHAREVGRFAAGTHSLIFTLAERRGDSSTGDGTLRVSGVVPPRVAREASLLLLKAARALHDNSHLLVRPPLELPVFAGGS